MALDAFPHVSRQYSLSVGNEAKCIFVIYFVLKIDFYYRSTMAGMPLASVVPHTVVHIGLC